MLIMLLDLRYALRQILRDKAFTTIVVVTLALGIGVNTAMFTILESLLWKPMPFDKPEQLVTVWEKNPRGTRDNVANANNYFAWHDRNRSFDSMAATTPTRANLGGDGEPEQVRGMLVTREYLDVLRVKPALGRAFIDPEMEPNAPPAAILSYDLWQRRFAGEASILGRRIVVNNRACTVVGVMPRGFRPPMFRSDLWMPLQLDRSKVNRGRYLMTLARLKEGAALEAAAADMDGIAKQLERERPDYNSKWGASVIALQEYASGSMRLPLLILLGAVGLVLLIACANIANLMLVRGAGREREMAISGGGGGQWIQAGETGDD